MRLVGWGLVTVALTCTVLTACSSPDALAPVEESPTSQRASQAPTTVAAEAPATSYLFTVSGQSGTIDGVGEDTGDEVLTLTLGGVREHATQFADRPIREAYVLATADLANRWQRWFADVPPNAVLSFTDPDDPTPRSIVVQLSDPVYDKGAGTLTFTGQHLHRQPDLSPDATEQVELPQRRAPEAFGAWTLFIDSVEGGCDLKPLAKCAGADLSNQLVYGKDLSFADLTGANLSKTNFVNTALTGTNMSNANLTGASLASATLAGTNFTGAKLVNAFMSQSVLFQANLTGADITGANFALADLSGAIWTDGRTCGPTSIGTCK